MKDSDDHPEDHPEDRSGSSRRPVSSPESRPLLSRLSPRYTRPGQAPDSPATQPSSGARGRESSEPMALRILLADDHAILREGLRSLLSAQPDMEVVAEASTGFETLQALRDHQPDFLLLDLQMPGLDGLKVARLALEEFPDLRILVLTMLEDEYFVKELFRIGVRGILLKGVHGDALITGIRQVQRGEMVLDPALSGMVAQLLAGRPPSKSQREGLEILSDRERQLLELIALGYTNAEVAAKLGVSRRTVEAHRASVMEKLGLTTRSELVRFALDHGLLQPSSVPTS